MKKLLNLLIPKERKFFTMFNNSADNLVKSSEVLLELMRENDAEKRIAIREHLNELEHVGDNYTHLILNELSKSFITPFDREDIHGLAVVIDDIIDYIHGAASRMVIYKVDEITPEMIDLSNLIHQSCVAIHRALYHLNRINEGTTVHDAYVEVNRIENEADEVFDSALGRLFEFEKDPIRLIKYKEIYTALETATDMAEDAVDLIKSVQVKNA